MKRRIKGVTAVAARSIKELVEIAFIARDLAHRLREDERCLQRRNQRKPDFPPISNKPFNDAAYQFMGKVTLCTAVDMYNCYCQDVLQLAVANNSAAVPNALRAAKRFGDGLKKATKKKTDPAVALLDMFRTGYIADGLVRDAIHTHLGIEQFPETELLCLCRNLVVHKRGVDSDGEIPATLKKIGTKRSFTGASGFPFGHLPIAVDHDNSLVIDDQVGLWAAEILTQQIHAMDQQFSTAYRLPIAPLPKITISRIFITENM